MMNFGGFLSSNFWTNYRCSSSASVEDLLSSNDCTVDKLLDDDDCLQEFKNYNDKLIKYFDHDKLKVLVDYITVLPEEDEQKRGHKYPFLSAEIFNCEINLVLDKFFEAPVKVKPLPPAALESEASPLDSEATNPKSEATTPEFEHSDSATKDAEKEKGVDEISTGNKAEDKLDDADQKDGNENKEGETEVSPKNTEDEVKDEEENVDSLPETEKEDKNEDSNVESNDEDKEQKTTDEVKDTDEEIKKE